MSEGRFNDLELLFIEEVLYQHGDYLHDLFVESIESKRLVDSRELVDGMDFQVSKEGINPVLYYSFPIHGRFIEIRYHKMSGNTQGWNNSRKEAVNAIWGRKNAKIRSKKKKDTRWYAKNLYGSLNRLIGILMYEFTEEEKNRLRTIIERRKSEL